MKPSALRHVWTGLRGDAAYFLAEVLEVAARRLLRQHDRFRRSMMDLRTRYEREERALQGAARSSQTGTLSLSDQPRYVRRHGSWWPVRPSSEQS